MKNLFVILVFAVLLFTGCDERKTVEEVDLSEIFASYGYPGCFAALDLKNNTYYVHNMTRTMTGFLPASTFKILNSLIILETGTLPDENTPVQWDGVMRDFPGWNTNLTLREAFKVSAVWVYQSEARKVGADAMLDFLTRCDYGNKDISAGVDKFWLEGNFVISPMEQLFFLKKFYLGKLPFSHQTLQTVKSMMLTEEGTGYQLYSKTGFAARVTPNIGWWVGFVETPTNTYLFAVNIESHEADAAFSGTRIEIGKQALKQLKMLP
ncbi:MAG: class D beta-lactamase [Brevinematales bacterium]|nr:class D beta-lactamase [Brevinematales bacterium]